MTDSGAVARAISNRRSVRGFLPDVVPAETLREILCLAGRAPSDTNIQPWFVHVLQGPTRARLSAALVAAHMSDTPAAPSYDYYPSEWRDPYLARRRALGWALYGLLGIEKGDRVASRRQDARNFDFFGAPVGLIFTLEDRMGIGAWIDLGMFMQTLMIAAQGFGVDSCAQAAFIGHDPIIRRHLALPDRHFTACGMALGYADPAEPANALVPDREPLDAFVRFHDGVSGADPTSA